MMRMLQALLVLVLFSTPGAVLAQNERVEEIATRGQSMRVLLTQPAGPVGSVILIAGGHGNLALSAEGKIGWGAGNQLVRTRALYAKAGYLTATPDLAPDLKRGKGVVPRYRWSDQHAADIGALVKHLRRIAAPVYLVGTSRGAISVINAAVKLSGEEAPDAIVLTAGMLIHIDPKQPSAERNVGHLERVKQPVLMIYHEKDQCRYTPASSAERFAKLLTSAKKVDISFLSGGSAVGDPCEANHYHGFRGLDAEVVRVITEWLGALKD
jgi:dienelactone hydrolase